MKIGGRFCQNTECIRLYGKNRNGRLCQTTIEKWWQVLPNHDWEKPWFLLGRRGCWFRHRRQGCFRGILSFSASTSNSANWASTCFSLDSRLKNCPSYSKSFRHLLAWTWLRLPIASETSDWRICFEHFIIFLSNSEFIFNNNLD